MAHFGVRILCSFSSIRLSQGVFPNKVLMKQYSNFSPPRMIPHLRSIVHTMDFVQYSTETSRGGARADPDDHPAVLPEELSKNVRVLTCESSAEGGICNVYMLGTNHFSKKSRKEAKALVSLLKPEVVFLEWRSEENRKFLTRKKIKKNKARTERQVIESLKKKETMFEVLFGWEWAMAKSARKAGVVGGLEFRVAYKEAKKHGATVILGDRPMQITHRRIWNKLSPWHLTKMLCSTLFPAPFQMLRNKLNGNGSLDDRFIILSKEFPNVMETIVDERDQYMSSELLKCARKSRSVVAVVGKGHLKGIQKYWKQPVAEDLMIAPFNTSLASRLWRGLTNNLVLSLLYMTHHKRKKLSR